MRGEFVFFILLVFLTGCIDSVEIQMPKNIGVPDFPGVDSIKGIQAKIMHLIGNSDDNATGNPSELDPELQALIDADRKNDGMNLRENETENSSDGCIYECCVEPDETLKLCPDNRDCVGHKCLGLECPYECCQENMTKFNLKNCRYEIPCQNTTCIKQECPFECCKGIRYIEKTCNETMECNNYKCSILDTDNDGLADFLEDRIRSDKTKIDTDGDNLSDFVEYYKLKTSVILKDTDEDDILDNIDPSPLDYDSVNYNITIYQPEVNLDLNVFHNLKNYLDAKSKIENRSGINWTRITHTNGTYENASIDYDNLMYPHPGNKTTVMNYNFRIWMKNLGIFDLDRLNTSYYLNYNCTTSNITHGTLMHDTVDLPRINSDGRVFLQFNKKILISDISEESWLGFSRCIPQRLVYNMSIDQVGYEKTYTQKM